MKNKNNIIWRFLFLCFLGLTICFNSVVVAQNLTRFGTQVSDNTAPNVLTPLEFSLLELNSSERGFLMPRMTTDERMRIPTQNLVGGMAIYNTSIECIEFYNTSRQSWMSACGDVEPAIFTIPDDKCNTISIQGDYAENVFLDSRKNIIILEVNVSTAGTYRVEAVAYNSTNELNGYAFTAEGIFPSVGTYTLVLKGYGTPKMGYPRQANGEPTAKDNIKFLLNNKLVKCERPNIVDTKAITFDMVSVVQTGEFFTKVNVLDPKTTGRIKVNINNISQGGIVEIHTDTQNGISFSGRKVLTQAEVNSKQATIDLIATGVPTTPANLNYDFVSNSYVRLEAGEAKKKLAKTVLISSVKVVGDCVNATIGKEFKQGEALTSAHLITIPVTVTATGRGRIIGTVATGNGQGELIQYTSNTVDFVFNSATNDVMLVEMKPLVGTGKPTVGDANIIMKIQLESSGVKEYDSSKVDEMILRDVCDLSIHVKSNWSVIDTSNITATFYSPKLSLNATRQYNGILYNQKAPYIPPYTVMAADGDMAYRVELSGIVPKTVGKWQFETKESNGIIFKGTGNFVEGDLNNNRTVTLKAYGVAGKDAPNTVVDIYDSHYPGVSLISSANFVKRLSLDFVYEPMVMYSIGDDLQSWHPGGRNGWTYSGGPQLARAKKNYGWSGIVRIDDLSIIGIGSTNYDTGYGTNTVPDISTNSTTFKNNLDNSDIVVIGGGASNAIIPKGGTQLTDLATAVNGHKVALIYGEGNPTYMSTFINKLSNGSFTTSSPGTSNAAVTTPYYIGTTVQNKLIWGDGLSYFGGAYEGVKLSGKSINGSYYGGGATFTVDQLPAGYVGIAGVSTDDSQNNIFAFMHESLGFVAIGNQGFMGGYNRASNGDAGWPTTSSSDGTPQKGVNQRNSNVESRNSWFLLNLVHWAIDYNQKNNPRFKR